MVETTLTDRQRDLLDIMGKSSQLMLSLINEILDFSKMEAGKMKVETKWFQLDTLIEDVVEFFAEASNKKRVDLFYNVNPCGMKIKSDEGRVRQVLLNLISNGLKFTEKGSVTITIEVIKKGELKFIVSDTGVGINSEKVPYLFRPFSQLDNKTSGGTGLGLVIITIYFYNDRRFQKRL